MKEYSDSFINKYDDMRISVSTTTTDDKINKNHNKKRAINIGIDIGCDGFYVDLTSKEVEKLILMIKTAKNKLNQTDSIEVI